MKAQDLRIGNLVTDEFYEHFKTVIKVESINEKGINLQVADDGGCIEMANHFIEPEYTFDKLQPIPLTPELLEAAGFSTHPAVPVWQLTLEHIKVDIVFFSMACALLCEGQSAKDKINLPDIKYLHQLQNLYYYLTAQELPITSLCVNS